MEDLNEQNGQPSGERQQTQAIARPSAGITRSGFGGGEIERRGETRATDLAERAKAEIQARYIVALQRPRSWEEVWQKLIKDCNRPTFAEAALYRLKRGRKKDEATGQWVDNWIIGLSIGFARAALRAMGNATLDEVMTYEDDGKQIWRITAMDLESNVTSSKDVTIPRIVERQKVNEYQEVVGQRVNAEGKQTFLIRATDDDMTTKVGAALSKGRRNLILELLPADIADDCKATILQTRQRADKSDPDLAKKKLIAAFGDIGVKVPQLEEYLGHPLDSVNPGEIEILRGIYQAIRDGETSWAAEMTERKDDAEPTEAEKAEKPKSTAAATKVRERIASNKKQRTDPVTPATPPPTGSQPMTEEEIKDARAAEQALADDDQD